MPLSSATRFHLVKSGRVYRHALLVFGKLVLTGFCLWWLASSIDWSDSILARPDELRLGWMAAGMACVTGSYYLLAARLNVVLGILDLPVPWRQALRVTLSGEFFTLFAFGALGGDAARILLLMTQFPDRKIAVTVAVMIDHLAGMIAISLCFLILAMTQSERFADAGPLGRGVLSIAFVAVGAGLLLVASCLTLALPRFEKALEKRRAKLSQNPFLAMWDRAFRRTVADWPRALGAAALSVPMLALFFTTFYCGCRAVGVETDVRTVLSVMPVADFFASLPISIAGLGVREKVFETLMSAWTEIPPAGAASGALAGFLCQASVALLGGAWFLHSAADRQT